ECVLRLLETLLERTPQSRMRDAMSGDGLRIFKSVVAGHIADAPSASSRPAPEPIGIHSPRSGGVALGVGLPFGHADAGMLVRMIAAVKQAGAAGLRTAPGRALLIVGLAPDAAPNLAASASELGFIADPADARRHVVACAGAPICRSGEMPTRVIAPSIADASRGLQAGEIVHLSG